MPLNQPLRRPRTLVVLGLAAALALAGSACGDDGDDEGDTASAPTTDSDYPGTESTASTTAPAAEEGGETTLVVSDFSFSEVTGAPGAAVPVRNDDSVAHTVTADDGAFDSGEVDPGGTAEFTAPAEPGSYAIHCEIHSSMQGTVTVS
jgi:plastocyanin